VQTSTGRLAYWTGSEWVEIGALGLDLSVAAADPAFTGAFLPLGAIPTGGATGQVLAKASGTNYDTAWENRLADLLSGSYPLLARPITAGRFLTTLRTVGGANQAVAQDRTDAFACIVPVDVTINQIGVEVMVANSGATGNLGIYASDSVGEPASLILDAGAIDASTTGVKTITISPALTLTAGVYFLAISRTSASSFSVRRDNSTPTLTNSTTMGQVVSDFAGGWAYIGTTAAGSMPATFSVDFITDRQYFIGVRVASLL
jgi:hypothetical protein